MAVVIARAESVSICENISSRSLYSIPLDAPMMKYLHPKRPAMIIRPVINILNIMPPTPAISKLSCSDSVDYLPNKLRNVQILQGLMQEATKIAYRIVPFVCKPQIWAQRVFLSFMLFLRILNAACRVNHATFCIYLHKSATKYVSAAHVYTE